AAQLQGAPDRRDRWLALAVERVPNAAIAVRLTEAELALAAGDTERARGTLERILDKEPEQPAALALLAQTHHARGDRQRLLELLPRLGRARLEPAQLEEIAAAALEAAGDLTDQELEAVWRTLPAPLRGSAALIARRAV